LTLFFTEFSIFSHKKVVGYGDHSATISHGRLKLIILLYSRERGIGCHALWLVICIMDVLQSVSSLLQFDSPNRYHFFLIRSSARRLHGNKRKCLLLVAMPSR